MKVLVAMDSFKGSLDSARAGQAVARALHSAIPSADCLVRCMADGGEGTLDAVIPVKEGKRITCTVSDPLGRRLCAEYGILDNTICVIELAKCAGLTLLSHSERNPMITTSYGVGEMIAHAICGGYRDFLIGIGGSATNDGGVGMLRALGFLFLDQDGNPLKEHCNDLTQLARIDTSHTIPALSDCRFRVICDVENPLLGPNGASAVFGPQKGADSEMLPLLEARLEHLSRIAKKHFPQSDDSLPGSGAAGGIGYALRTFLHAELMKGAEWLLKARMSKEELANVSLVVTGEGRIDKQTKMGKAPITLARYAKKRGAKVIAFCGCVGEGFEECLIEIDAIFAVSDPAMPPDLSMRPDIAEQNLYTCALQFFRTHPMIKSISI